jgi:anti-anti-sigma regulatory factor
VRIDQSTRDGCAILAPVGHLDLAAVPSLRQLLLKRLNEQPVAVICDLSGLRSVDEACAAVFASAANHPASRWPETNLLLCCAQSAVAAVLGRLRTPKFLPMHATLEDALTHAVARPPYLRAELPLGPSPTAPAAARRFVRDTCWYWRLEEVDDPDDPMEQLWVQDLIDRAVLVASELVTNAVLHANGPLRLRLALHGERLHLAVADQSPRLLRLAADPGDPEAVGGRGLAVVEQLASPGGCTTPPRAARSSAACWNTDQLRALLVWERPRPAGAAARRAERPTRVTGTIRPGVKLEQPQPPAATWPSQPVDASGEEGRACHRVLTAVEASAQQTDGGVSTFRRLVGRSLLGLGTARLGSGWARFVRGVGEAGGDLTGDL